MTLQDLPQEIQNKLRSSRLELHNTWKCNDAYHVCFTDATGTRYFAADRVCMAWNNNHGAYMPFGGGTYWKIRYGKILWDRRKDALGYDYEYFWVRSGKIFNKSANGTDVPKTVGTKKEVMEIAKAIGIFDI